MLPLAGCSILLVEDEPLIAIDVQDCLQKEGASVFYTGHLAQALELAERPGLSAAVIDFRLSCEDSDLLCDRLAQRGVPFLFHSGWRAEELHERWHVAPVLSKPVPPETIAAALRELLNANWRRLSDGLAQNYFR